MTNAPARRIVLGRNGVIVGRPSSDPRRAGRRWPCRLRSPGGGRRPGYAAERDQLTQRMPTGCTIKVHVVYNEPFWRADGLSGEATSDAGRR